MSDLDLNVAAAQGDLGRLMQAHHRGEEARDELLSNSNRTFQEAMHGEGAQAGTDFAHQMNDAISAHGEVVLMVQHALDGGVNETHSFDHSGTAANYA